MTDRNGVIILVGDTVAYCSHYEKRVQFGVVTKVNVKDNTVQIDGSSGRRARYKILVVKTP